MTTLKFPLVKEGDWISGTTHLDEKFIGFVQSIDEDGIIKLWATQSDRKEIVGTSIQARITKVKKLAEHKPTSPEEVQSLIQLALATHDKEWFEQLQAMMNSLSTLATDLSETYILTNLKERL